MAASSIHIADAEGFLQRHLAREVEQIELVGEGAWSRCFGFADRGRQLVIRFGRYVDDFQNDRRASSFRSATLPVPEVLEIGRAFDGYFAISTRVHGEPLESLDAAGWNAVLPSLLAALDAMRSVPLPPDTGYGGWGEDGRATHRSWRDFLMAVDADTPDHRTHGWRRRLIDSPIGDGTFRIGYEKLGAWVPTGASERRLVHGDLINRNVLVASDRIGGVFDWGCSIYGDPLYDVAWIEFWKPWFDALATVDFLGIVERHHATTGWEVPSFEPRLRACMIHIGLAHLAYNAHTGNLEDLRATEERLLPLLG